MKQVYPNLYNGGSVDLYMTLFVYDKPGDCPISAVLDCTPDLPSRKWKKAKHVTLKKIGFPKETPLNSSNLKNAISYIHKFRTENKSVLVTCKNGNIRSQLICIAYLMAKRDFSWRDAEDRVRNVEEKAMFPFPVDMVQSVKKYIQKLYKKEGSPCDCSGNQVCDICQVSTGYEMDKV